MSDAFDPYFKWLGIPATDRPPHHYRLLGIELFESDADVISNAADARMAQLKSYQSGPFAAVSQKMLNELAAAKVCLLNLQKKAQYDLGLRARLEEKKAVPGAGEAAPPHAGDDSLAFLDDAAAPIHAATRKPTIADHASMVPGRRPPGARKGPRQKHSNSSAWLISLGLAAVALLVAGAALYFSSAGDDKGKPARPETVALADGRESKEKSRKMPADSSAPKSKDSGETTTTESPPPKASAAPPPSRPDTSPPRPTETTPAADKPADNRPPAATVVPAATPSQKTSPKGPEPPPEKPVAQLPSAPAHTPAKKLPAPGDDQQRTVATKIREIFRKEFEAAETTEGKLKLAARLDEEGEARKGDPAARYVFWRMAAGAASLAGKASAAMQIVDKMQDQFDVDGDEMKSEVLAAAAERAAGMTPAGVRDLAETALRVADAAIANDQLEAAAKLVRLAQSVARRIRDPELNRDVLAKNQELDRHKKRRAVVEKALATLAADPADAEANLTVGQWYCFVRGDWEKGLPHLLKGGREDLVDLARQELAKPAAAADQVTLADAWWNLAERDKSLPKAVLLARARHWYDQAVDSLSGLEKTRAEKRLESEDRPATAAAERPVRTARGIYQKGNVALLANGTKFDGKVKQGAWQVLFDGDSTHYSGHGGEGYVDGVPPFEWTITLGKVYSLREIRFLPWSQDDRYYRYRLSISSDGKNFTPLVDRSQGEWRGWQAITFPVRPVKFIKFDGLFCNRVFGMVEFEAYCLPIDQPRK